MIDEVPEGWERVSDNCISRTWPYGLHAVFTLEDGQRKLSASRSKQWPGWNEVGKLVYGTDLFDHNRPVYMEFPRKLEWVEEHSANGPFVVRLWQDL